MLLNTTSGGNSCRLDPSDGAAGLFPENYVNTITYALIQCVHDDVINWKRFPRYWPFVWEIHRSPVNSPHKGPVTHTLMLVRITCYTNSRNDRWFETTWRSCDVIVMSSDYVTDYVGSTRIISMSGNNRKCKYLFKMQYQSRKIFWLNTNVSNDVCQDEPQSND